MSIDIKSWLDKNIVPLLQHQGTKLPSLQIHSEIHSSPPLQGGTTDDVGNPLEFDTQTIDLICVYLMAIPGCWPKHVRRLLKDGFFWDYMRDFAKVVVNGESRIIFGGDGSPFLHNSNLVSCRLFKKLGDVGTILEVGCQHGNKVLAQDDVKELYRMFQDEDGLNLYEVQTKYTPPFGGQ